MKKEFRMKSVKENQNLPICLALYAPIKKKELRMKRVNTYFSELLKHNYFVSACGLSPRYHDYFTTLTIMFKKL